MSVGEFRARLAEVLDRVRRQRGPLYLTQRGQAAAVLLGVEEFEALLDQLEYLDDSVEAILAKQRRDSGKEKAEPLEIVVRRLQKRGRLPG